MAFECAFPMGIVICLRRIWMIPGLRLQLSMPGSEVALRMDLVFDWVFVFESWIAMDWVFVMVLTG